MEITRAARKRRKLGQVLYCRLDTDMYVKILEIAERNNDSISDVVRAILRNHFLHYDQVNGAKP